MTMTTEEKINAVKAVELLNELAKEDEELARHVMSMMFNVAQRKFEELKTEKES